MLRLDCGKESQGGQMTVYYQNGETEQRQTFAADVNHAINMIGWDSLHYPNVEILPDSGRPPLDEFPFRPQYDDMDE
jgi:hypothetical protein